MENIKVVECCKCKDHTNIPMKWLGYTLQVLQFDSSYHFVLPNQWIHTHTYNEERDTPEHNKNPTYTCPKCAFVVLYSDYRDKLSIIEKITEVLKGE